MSSIKSNNFIAILCLCGFLIIIYALLTPSCEKNEQVAEKESDFDSFNYYWKKNTVKNERDDELEQDLKSMIKTYDPNSFPRIQQRGDYWVFYNILTPEKTFNIFESITYTTHGDFTFLDNLEPLLERWLGPVSIALYAPGDDFHSTIESIHYLRDCTSLLVREFVSFHIYFKSENFPEEIPNVDKIFKEIYNCDISPSFKTIQPNETYKSLNKLPYPVNVGRNIAKETSQTYFVLASDIELYPSENIIQNFLEMINKTDNIFDSNRVVFPLNLFEVRKDVQVPKTKTELLSMLANKTAINFHQKVCAKCHNTPKYEEWKSKKETEGLNVFHVGKRLPPFEKWEPIYIGSKNDPAYDERLTWEGKSDKMTQGYILCVKDYDMKILDNAFLVHKPGIKVYKADRQRDVYVGKTNSLIKNVIHKELETLFGKKDGCVI